MDTCEHDINTVCPFCGGNLYADYDAPDVIRCDNCDLEMDMCDYINTRDNKNIIKRAAHGSSGASELKARKA